MMAGCRDAVLTREEAEEIVAAAEVGVFKGARSLLAMALLLLAREETESASG